MILQRHILTYQMLSASFPAVGTFGERDQHCPSQFRHFSIWKLHKLHARCRLLAGKDQQFEKTLDKLLCQTEDRLRSHKTRWGCSTLLQEETLANRQHCILGLWKHLGQSLWTILLWQPWFLVLPVIKYWISYNWGPLLRSTSTFNDSTIIRHGKYGYKNQMSTRNESPSEWWGHNLRLSKSHLNNAHYSRLARKSRHIYPLLSFLPQGDPETSHTLMICS